MVEDYDISGLELKVLCLEAQTTSYRLSRSQISKADAFLKFSEIEKRMEELI
jgi:hypothetical protein